MSIPKNIGTSIDTLIQALSGFACEFERSGYDFGKFSISNREIVSYPNELPSSPEILTFYQNVELKEKPALGGAFMLEFAALENLQEAQIGWRMKKETDGVLKENQEWSQSKVVIGNRNGDAVSIDTSANESPVYGHIQAEELLLSNSMARFFATLSECIHCENSSFKMDVYDEDFELKPSFKEKITKILERNLSASESEGFYRFFFG